MKMLCNQIKGAYFDAGDTDLHHIKRCCINFARIHHGYDDEFYFQHLSINMSDDLGIQVCLSYFVESLGETTQELNFHQEK